MGAVHRLDLTSDVTHLLVGDPNTPKYRYVARERPDVKILTTEWVEALRQLWIQDADINLQELEENHRLPVFAGLRICLTGFDDGACFWRGRVLEIVATFLPEATLTNIFSGGTPAASAVYTGKWC